jgi:hypothetical protein
VAGFLRNGWTQSSGISGRFNPESVDEISGIPNRLHDDLEVQGYNRPRRGPTTSLGAPLLARSEGLFAGFAGPRALFYSSASRRLKWVRKNSKFSCQLGAECTFDRCRLKISTSSALFAGALKTLASWI